MSASRPLPYPVTEPPAFLRAVERGTRTLTGSPGPAYWQQRTEYRLSAVLDPSTARLKGQGSIRYFNHSPDTLPRVAVHLRQNVYRPGAARSIPLPVTGGIELDRVVASGRELLRSTAGDQGARWYLESGTIAWLELPHPLASGASVDLEFAWSFEVPGVGDYRMGQDGEVFYLGYWYPQLAVYDDLRGWNAEPYLGWGEFYMGYGDYDVDITVPAGWLVAATGTHVNADEVLRPMVVDRLSKAMQSAEVVHVVQAGERGAGRATRGQAGDALTWRFTARNVRDFAFGTSDRYVWDATSVGLDGPSELPDGRVTIHSFYRPGAPVWEHSLRYGSQVVARLSRYLWTYPYPQMSLVEGILRGGEEYPMITLMAGPTDTLTFYGLEAHEIAHMWFPIVVGSNEKLYAWMDEGLTSFNVARAAEGYLSVDVEALGRERYLARARAGGEASTMMRMDQYPPDVSAGAVASYQKPGAVLATLRSLLGEAVFDNALREYGRRWAFRHPQPWDLWNTFEDVSGRDLSWFWRSWFYETWTLDQAIAGVRTVGDSVEITVEDRGLVPMPVRLLLTRAGGQVEVREIDVGVWLAGAVQHVLRVPALPELMRVEIDAENRFPDVERKNQIWTR